jgi:uncharacterized protein (TIGR02246 family)
MAHDFRRSPVAESIAKKSEQEIEQALAGWAAAVAGSDAEAIGLLVTEDAEFWSHGVAPVRGRQAVVDAMRSFFARYGMQQDFDRQEILVSQGLAFVRGMEVNRLTPRDGGDSTVVRQRAFSVLVQGQDGNWRFARGMTNRPPTES